jgi:hypothetical protein
MFRNERLKQYLDSAPHVKPGHIHVVFDAYGFVPVSRNHASSNDVLIAALSFGRKVYRAGVDIAWPSLAVLSGEAKEANCSRPSHFLASFRGVGSSDLRKRIVSLHNPSQRMIIQVVKPPTLLSQGSLLTKVATKQITDLLHSSEFTLIPRGQNLYSFRLIEALAAGSIPVIINDDWVLPFSELLDYSSFTVRIKESDWDQTLSILKAITPEQRCVLKEEGFLIYQSYFATMKAQLSALFTIVASRKNLRYDSHQ